MMKRRYGMAIVWVCLIMVGSVYASDTDSDPRAQLSSSVGTVYSQNAFKVPYLGMHGAFTIDPQTISATDPRNPRRVVFRKMEFFSFYKDRAGRRPLAEQCQYVYKGAAGDPYYYPDIAKTSVWDLFELASGEAACNNFFYVIVRPPHGDPIHMHMRYGDAQSSFRKLLNLSDGPEDPTQLDPWWSVYCAAGISGCD